MSLNAFNPVRWLRAFSHFMSCWFVTLPLAKLLPAAPAMIAIAAVMIVGVLTFASDPRWRRGLVLDQLQDAKQVGSSGDIAVLARRLLMDSPGDLRLRLEAAVAEIDGESKPQAIESITRLAKQDKFGLAALWLLENEYSPIAWDQWNDSKKAEFGMLLGVAADAHPENKSVASVYADYLLLNGAQEKALREIDKLVSIQPARAIQGAMILRQTGRETQAIAMATEAAELLTKKGTEEPENVSVALMRAQICLFLKQYENAINILSRTAKLSDDQRLRAATAESLVLWSRDQATIRNQTERFARQLTLLSKAMELAPNHPLVINDLMTVVLQCADEKDAKVAQLRDILVQGVAPELAHFIRGTAAMMRNDINEATLHLELSAKSLPSVPAVLNNLAVALATRKDADLDRALTLVDAALKQVPKQPYFHETRAQILLKQKNYRDAVVSFEQAMAAEALREQVHKGLSDCYAALGQKELAIDHKRLSGRIKAAQTPAKPVGDLKVDFDRTRKKAK